MHSPEAEQSVIGSILLQPDLIHDTTLTADHFNNPQNRIIFGQMLDLRDKQQPIDFVTVSASLGDILREVGGISYLMELTRSVPSTADIAWHEKIIRDKYLMRTGMKSVQELLNDKMDDPAKFSAKIISIAETMDFNPTKQGFKHIRDGLVGHFDQLNEKKYNPKRTGISTLGEDLDKITGKWQKQTLNILAARPSVGKTAAMLNNATRNGREGMTVAIFSLEMPDVQLYDRMISAEANIDGDRIRNATLYEDEWVKYTVALGYLAEFDIYIDDRPGLTVQEIRSAVRKLKKTNPDLIVYIDYLQLIKSGKKMNSRTEEVGYISNSLKQMARENDCPVIALAQLSRDVEKRQDKRPMMSDLRESGNIEQDADTITFLYRDDYYNQDSEKKNIIEFIVSKNRNGAIGTAEMVNLKNYGKFMNYDRSR
jgi:replicative DNA helicase